MGDQQPGAHLECQRAQRREDRETTFTRILREHGGRITAIARSYAAGDEADDLRQEILLQLWRSLERFEGRASLGTWVYRVALNTALGHRRRRHRRRWLRVGIDVQPALEPRQQDGPRSQAAVLEEFLSSLSKVDRALFLLYLDDLTYREMADITGVSENNVGVKLHRLKQRFAERYVRA